MGIFSWFDLFYLSQDGVPFVFYKREKLSDMNFERRWQTDRLSKQLKVVMEREFFGLKTDLTTDFDERIIHVVDKIDQMVNKAVEKQLEVVKSDVMKQIEVNKSVQAE